MNQSAEAAKKMTAVLDRLGKSREFIDALLKLASAAAEVSLQTITSKNYFDIVKRIFSHSYTL